MKILGPNLLFLTIVFITPNSYSTTLCDGILQQGIRDSFQVLDDRAQYDLAHHQLCQNQILKHGGSTSAEASGQWDVFSQGSGGYSESDYYEADNSFCRDNLDESYKKRKHRSLVKKVNRGIVAAWESCIAGNRDGFAHYIEPTSDPSQFTYRITFNSDGAPYEESISAWTTTNVQCKSNDEEVTTRFINSKKVNPSGIRFLCTREPKTVSVITIDVPRGGRNLRPLEIKNFKSSTMVKSQPQIKNTDSFTGPVYLSPNNLLENSVKNVHGRFTFNRTYWSSSVNVAGVNYRRSVSLHPKGKSGSKSPWAQASFNIPKGARYFRSIAGLAKREPCLPNRGHALVRVYIDGILSAKASIGRTASSIADWNSRNPIAIPANAKLLKLMSHAGSNFDNNCDGVVFADAKFTK